MDIGGLEALLSDVSVLAAAASVGAAVAVGAVGRTVGRSRWLLPAGPTVLAAVLLGCQVQGGSPMGTLAEVVAIGALVAVPGRRRKELVAMSAGVASLLVALLARPPSERIEETVLAAMVVAMAATVSSLDGPRGSRVTTWALTVVAGGVFLCVPETDTARLVAVATGVALLGVLAGYLRPVGPGAATALVALLGWISLVEGEHRTGASVGGAACLLALGLLPLARRFGARDADAPWWFEPAVVAGVVLICSRVAGLRSSGTTAGVIAMVTLAAGAGVLWLAGRRGAVPARRRPTPAP
jgi:hypothetical protein